MLSRVGHAFLCLRFLTGLAVHVEARQLLLPYTHCSLLPTDVMKIYFLLSFGLIHAMRSNGPHQQVRTDSHWHLFQLPTSKLSKPMHHKHRCPVYYQIYNSLFVLLGMISKNRGSYINFHPAWPIIILPEVSWRRSRRVQLVSFTMEGECRFCHVTWEHLSDLNIKAPTQLATAHNNRPLRVIDHCLK